MNSLPVIGRELLVAGRRPATYRQRLIAATVVVLVAFGILVLNGAFSHPATLSKQVFVTVSLLAFVYALLAGVFLTTDCICSERQEGTLPLLFLTRLNGFDIALGKLISTSAVAGYALLAVMPVLGLPTLIGGVTGTEFARVCLVLIVTLLWSLTTGLLCSTLCRDARSPMGTSLGIVLLTCLVFGITWSLGRVSNQFAQGIALTPGGALLHSFDVNYRTQTGAGRFWLAIECLAFCAAVQFTAVSLLLRRFQAEPPAKISSQGSMLRRKQRQPMLLNPYLWLLRREKFPTPAAHALAAMIVLLFTVSTLPVAVGGASGMARMLLLVSLFSALAFHWFVKGLAVLHASRLLAEQRQSGALELLLTTPLPPHAILAAHRQAKGAHFQGLAVCGALVNLGLLLAMCSTSNLSGEALFVNSSFCIGGAILLPVDCAALRWIALHEALAGKRHHRAVLAALWRVFPLSWVIFALGITVLIGGHSSGEAAASFFLIWALVFGALTHATGRHRASLLRDRFRAIAAGDAPDTIGHAKQSGHLPDQRASISPSPA